MIYFKVLCFVWAAVGIGSRVAMVWMGSRWARWEQEKAYAAERPAWVVVVAVLGLLVIASTWWVYLAWEVPHGWVLATLLSLTFVKLTKLLFAYDQFRAFLVETLADDAKMMQLNVAVLVLAGGLIAMGIWLY